MKDIVNKLKSLIYGEEQHESETRNSFIIEDSESLKRQVWNMKRSCSCSKIGQKNTQRSRSANRAQGINLDKPVNEYADTYKYSKDGVSWVLKDKPIRSSRSINLNIANAWSKGQIKTVKVYKLNLTDRNKTK